MAVSDTIDVTDMITGTGPFGPSELRQLCEALAEGGEMFRSLRLAVRDLEAAGDRSPASTVRLGVGQYLLGRFADAIDTLKAADGSAMALYYLGRAQAAAEAFADAISSFRGAGRAGYDKAACEAEAAACLRKSGQLDEAREALDAIAGEAEASADYWCQLGLLAAARGDDLPVTIDALERAIAVDPLHSESLFELGVLNDRLGNDDEARDCYRDSLKRYPATVGALLNLGLLHEDRDEFSEAQRCYNRDSGSLSQHPRAQLFLKDSSRPAICNSTSSRSGSGTSWSRRWGCLSATSSSRCGAATACRRWGFTRWAIWPGPLSRRSSRAKTLARPA